MEHVGLSPCSQGPTTGGPFSIFPEINFCIYFRISFHYHPFNMHILRMSSSAIIYFGVACCMSYSYIGQAESQTNFSKVMERQLLRVTEGGCSSDYYAYPVGQQSSNICFLQKSTIRISSCSLANLTGLFPWFSSLPSAKFRDICI